MSSGYRRGYLDGLLAQTWVCGNCGNRYMQSVDYCPNIELDEAYAKLKADEAEGG